MKTKLVLWGTNDKDERLLIAMELIPETSQVNVYTFPATIATEEFGQQMLNDWRVGKEVAFIEGHSTMQTELSMSSPLLPEGLKVERDDLITRAQTEWHFIVLSSKLNQVYQTELAELKTKIGNLTKFENSAWEELKGFWGKVQEQVRERNLFREHADELRDKTNSLFDELKVLRNKLDQEFKELSRSNVQKFKGQLQELEERVEKGLHLQPIFEELKDIQRRFKGAKFTKEDRSSVWEKLDGLFKVVKEKRFGPIDEKQNSPTGRLERRYNGLLEAIKRMEQSIRRDRDDLDFQNRKIATTDGQLEAQIRKAKIKMIDERIASKQEKLEDMNKTKGDLERKMEVQRKKDEQLAEKKRVEEAKRLAEEKIAAQIKQQEEDNKQKADELEKAAEAIANKVVETSEEVPAQTVVAATPEVVPDTIEETTDTVKAAPAQTAETVEGEEKTTEKKRVDQPSSKENIGDAIVNTLGHSFADVMDTAKAVAMVVSEKIQDAVKEIKEEFKEEIEEVKEETAEIRAKAGEVITEAKEELKEGIEELKEETTEIRAKAAKVVEEAKAKAVEVTGQVTQQVVKAKEEVVEKVVAVKETVVESSPQAEPETTTTAEEPTTSTKDKDPLVEQIKANILKKLGYDDVPTDTASIQNEVTTTEETVTTEVETTPEVIEPAPLVVAAPGILTVATPIVETKVTETVESVTESVEETSKVTSTSEDDLKKIEGIGPKIEAIIKNKGITTFQLLSETPVDLIKSWLNEAGTRFATHDPGTWPRQAGMAAKGEWDALKVWQDELDGGRVVK